MKSLKGKLLISAGGLFDPNFRHTVVLIGEHTAEGAAGVILNRRLDRTVEEAVPGFAGLIDPHEHLYEGGPVEPAQPVVLVEGPSPGLIDVNVFGAIGFLTDSVPADLWQDVHRARVFAGHAGWGPGQLENEMAANAWIIEDATADDVFTNAPESLWRRILERKGPPYARMARIPFDPTTN